MRKRAKLLAYLTRGTDPKTATALKRTVTDEVADWRQTQAALPKHRDEALAREAERNDRLWSGRC